MYLFSMGPTNYPVALSVHASKVTVPVIKPLQLLDYLGVKIESVHITIIDYVN